MNRKIINAQLTGFLQVLHGQNLSALVMVMDPKGKDMVIGTSIDQEAAIATLKYALEQMEGQQDKIIEEVIRISKE